MVPKHFDRFSNHLANLIRVRINTNIVINVDLQTLCKRFQLGCVHRIQIAGTKSNTIPPTDFCFFLFPIEHCVELALCDNEMVTVQIWFFRSKGALLFQFSAKRRKRRALHEGARIFLADLEHLFITYSCMDQQAHNVRTR